MAYSEDHIALAAEYALGTLDADERAQVETMMAVDKEFTAIVQAWEFRLGVLNQMVGSVEPRPIVWENIQRAIGHGGEQAPLVLPEAPPETPPPSTLVAANDAYEAAIAQASPPVVDDANVIRLAGRAKRWRNIASATGALAAALVVMLAMQVYQPDLLPQAIRPKPRIQTVEIKTPPPPAGAQYVALLQSDSNSPAFILTVDAATRNFTVRKVGARPEPGKSYELWIVSDKLQRPRSLGVIGGNDFTARPVLSGYAPDVVNQATFAVSVEPEGGSTTGAPTGPVVFSGKLIETVPQGAPTAR
ncbi:anti-sigma factor [Bradyrhizobium lablabi]|uniref:anti-sigma factor n=1 Tax=Bradyrhizobium lablabi TaxID=722472 RepID=UPI001BA6F6C2|nr:anti-sigma factor [Bradyrhizobium lablabi]MBR1126560.1 anti-sigma factor [Bradyrhizobium lablabi]